MALNSSTATYQDAKAARLYVAILEADEVTPNTGWDGTQAGFATASWHLIGGVRSDRSDNQSNSQQTFHYGESDAVSTQSPPSRSLSIDASYAPDNTGQKILRWAQENNKQVGFARLYDGTNGYAVISTVGGGGQSGDAQGGLQAAPFTINPIGTRISIGTSDVYVPA